MNNKIYLGIDCGKQGFFTFLNQDGIIVDYYAMPLIGKEYDKQQIKQILEKHKIHKVIVEKPTSIFGVGKSAVASLMQCVGMIEGMLVALDLSYIMVQPKQWQKQCWSHVKVQKDIKGKTDTKATSILAAVNLFNHTDFKVTNKGNSSKNYNDGFCDSALIAEYGRRMF